jgi:hypothetical protein
MESKSELWNGPPEVPETIATDLSCQGVMATTLLEALQEMQNEEPTKFNEDVCDRILQSFGEAVVSSYKNPHLPQGPPVRLTGRLDHSNRYQSKWRLVVDETQFNSITTATATKKNPSSSAQEVSNTMTQSNLRIEILAYNDI